MRNLILGDSVHKLKELPENSIDAVVTDPPYGLSFMGKHWDYDVPTVELWREVLRVLKPGGHVLSFGGTRTYHRMVVNIEDAGFEIRDQVQWLYGSGFPKSHNIKDGDLKGFGTALKPANEPICLARKPLEKGLTVAENVLKWGTGSLNIDGSRIATTDKLQKLINDTNEKDLMGNMKGKDAKGRHIEFIESGLGRWPANLLLDETAAEMLDAQSGISKSTGGDGYKNSMFCGGKKTGGHGLGDVGGASRFFYVAKASKRERNAGLEGMPEKAQGAYGEFAGDGRGRQTEHQPTANYHPTVKPIKLMEYLITLITQPKGTVLDPFMGSGSTGIAAKNLEFNFIGIELDAEYFEIAKRRMGNNND